MSKKVTICVPLDEDLLATIRTLKGSPLLADASEVNLVHVFRVEKYVYMVPPYIYPDEAQRPEVEKSVQQILESLKNDLGVDATVNTVCLFDESPKVTMDKYLKDSETNLAIVATRGKHGVEGLFTSSFADHLNKFSPCDIYVLRPRN